MDDFPWITEWNGIFMPIGDAVEMGCLMAVVMGILWMVGCAFYVFVKLTTEGFKAAANGKFGKALAYLFAACAPPLIFFGCCAGYMAMEVGVSFLENVMR